jgi:hypothetical protein
MIPATRFDTITSYVDVIYQHHQKPQPHPQPHHHQQQQQQQSNPKSPSEYQSGTLNDYPENISEGHEISINENDDNVIYLNPSDGIDGDQSFMATCPICAMMVMTNIEPFPGKKSHKMACFLSPFLLCWIPFNFTFGKKWMDIRHSCPKCQFLIAIYKK